MNDPVADLLTRIRNGQQARKSSISTPCSKLRTSVLDVLKREGYIRDYSRENIRKGIDETIVELKYYDGEPVIKEISRVSSPGCRVYSKIKDKLPEKYRLESKQKFMKNHSKKSKLFTIRNLVKMRLYGEINSKNVIQNKNPLATFTHVPFIIVFLISILPKRIIFLYVLGLQYFNKNKV